MAKVSKQKLVRTTLDGALSAHTYTIKSCKGSANDNAGFLPCFPQPPVDQDCNGSSRLTYPYEVDIYVVIIGPHRPQPLWGRILTRMGSSSVSLTVATEYHRRLPLRHRVLTWVDSVLFEVQPWSVFVLRPFGIG